MSKKLAVVSLSVLMALSVTEASLASTATENHDMAGYKLFMDFNDSTGSTPVVDSNGSGRADIGWGGNGGGNLEAYSKGHASRPGEFKFIYGGAPSTGKIVFQHYDGSSWTKRAALDADGKLTVGGGIQTTEVVVQSSLTWPDYVFAEEYKLTPIDELAEFVSSNHHLPGMPTAEEVGKSGVNLGEVSANLLKKVEELTLYVIQLKKQNDSLQKQIEESNR